MSLISPNIIEKHPKAFIIGGLVALLVGIGLIWWAYSGNRTDTERKLDTNIGVDQGKNAVVTNLITNQEKVVENVEIKANQANANLTNSLRRDTNVFSGSQADADDAFCSRFPTDSSCAKWRLRHGR